MTYRTFGIALVALLLAVACTPSSPTPTSTAVPTNTPVASPTPTPTQPLSPGTSLPSIAQVVAQVKPAVVAIAVEIIQRDIFGRSSVISGAGSGVIFDQRGYVLTNNHVVEGARQIQVALEGYPTLKATLVGHDPLTDLAVIKLEGEGFPTAPLGDSETLRVGDWVIAIGNALALQGGPTVTLGVVSAKDRTITTDANVRLNDMIQTDAAINPGNSGGPLLNLAGEVVAINTAIALQGEEVGQTVSAQGIGFAVAMDTAKAVAQQLVENGRVIWPYLGVGVEDITPQIALDEELPVRSGVIIRSLELGGPAQRAGLAVGDIITRFANSDATTTKELQRIRRSLTVGQTVTVTVLRSGKARDFQVKLEEQPREG